MYKFFKILCFIILSFLNFYQLGTASEQKIKIGLLVPLTGNDKEIGYQIVKSTKIALKEINSNNLEIYPMDTNSDPNKTLKSAIKLKEKGIKIVLGPVFYKSLNLLNEIQDMIFVSLTNQTLGLPKNVISGGVNATSQLNSIKKFIKENNIKKTILLTPNLDYKEEIKKD